MKKTGKLVRDILSWVLLVVVFCLMVYSLLSAREAMKTGESKFLFGYRPVLVLTGSMEPYMKTNGIVLTREVDSMSDLQIGDVVTYHLYDEYGQLMRNEQNRPVRITHRIIDIDGEDIYTKGDNNNVNDGYAIGIENVEAEVVGVWNGAAKIVEKWQTTAGKVMLISIPVFFILLSCTVDMLLQARKEEKRKAL